MATTSTYKDVKSEADFPTGLPQFGIWWQGDQKFTLNKALSPVKVAITNNGTNHFEINSRWAYNKPGGEVVFKQNINVYELHGNTWHLIYEMKKGHKRDAHELWQGKAPSGPQSVSDDEVSEAIRSILGQD